MSNPSTTLVDLLTGRATSAGQRLRVRSAVNPMLWACAVVSIPCFVMAHFFRADGLLYVVLLVSAGLPVLAAVVSYGYFAVTAPEKLQSEDYQLKHEIIELTKSKGSPLEINQSSLESIINPDVLNAIEDRNN